jgi:hypothetical protein
MDSLTVQSMLTFRRTVSTSSRGDGAEGVVAENFDGAALADGPELVAVAALGAFPLVVGDLVLAAIVDDAGGAELGVRETLRLSGGRIDADRREVAAWRSGGARN